MLGIKCLLVIIINDVGKICCLGMKPTEDLKAMELEDSLKDFAPENCLKVSVLWIWSQEFWDGLNDYTNLGVFARTWHLG